MIICTAKCSVHTLHTRVPLKCTEIYVYIRKIHIHTRTSVLETSEMFCHVKLDVSNIFFKDVKLSDKILNHKYRDTMRCMPSKLGLISRGKTLSMPGIH